MYELHACVHSRMHEQVAVFLVSDLKKINI